MMMVVGVPDGFDDVGRGVWSAEEEAESLQKQPPFDPKTTRAGRDIGTLAEFFRSYRDLEPKKPAFDSRLLTWVLPVSTYLSVTDQYHKTRPMSPPVTFGQGQAASEEHSDDHSSDYRTTSPSRHDGL